jgi:hypothetical protein
VKAIDYIRKGWTQGSLAKDALGVIVDIDAPDAVKWCSIGAIYRAYPKFAAQERAIRALKKILNASGSISDWNDDTCRTKKEVIEAFEKAGI